MAFDPDKFIASRAGKPAPTEGFDPDAFLASLPRGDRVNSPTGRPVYRERTAPGLPAGVTLPPDMVGSDSERKIGAALVRYGAPVAAAPVAGIPGLLLAGALGAGGEAGAQGLESGEITSPGSIAVAAASPLLMPGGNAAKPILSKATAGRMAADAGINTALANVQSYIDNGSLAGVDQDILAALTGAGGRLVSRAMEGNNTRPESEYAKLTFDERARKRAAFEKYGPQGLTVAPSEFDYADPVAQSLAGDPRVRSMARVKSNPFFREKIRRDLGIPGNGLLDLNEVDLAEKAAFAPFEEIRRGTTTGPRASQSLENIKKGQQDLSDMWQDYRNGNGNRVELRANIEALQKKLDDEWDLLNFNAVSQTDPGVYAELQRYYKAKDSADFAAAKFAENEGWMREKSMNPQYRPKSIEQYAGPDNTMRLAGASGEEAVNSGEAQLRGWGKSYRDSMAQANESMARLRQFVSEDDPLIKELNRSREIIKKAKLLKDLGVVSRGGSGTIDPTALGAYYNEFGEKGLTGGFREVADVVNSFATLTGDPDRYVSQAPGRLTSLFGIANAARGDLPGAAAAAVPYVGDRVAQRMVSDKYQRRMAQSLDRTVPKMTADEDAFIRALRLGIQSGGRPETETPEARILRALNSR